MEDPKQLIASWGKSDNRQARLKRRRIIWISILGVIAVVLILLGIYYFTDAFSKPVKTLNSLPADGEWAMFGRDLTHSGSLNPALGLPQGNVRTLLTAGDVIHSSPVIAGGVLYVGSRDGKLYAIAEDTGNKLWEFQTDSWVESSAAVVNNVVYFGSNDGHLYALDARTGTRLWAFNTRFPVKSSPAVANGKVYFGADDYAIYAVNAATGRQAWKVTTGNSVASSPAVAEGIVFAGSMDGTLYAVDARSGRVRLKFPSNRTFISSPVVEDGTVYINTSNGSLYVLRGNAKNWLWEQKIRPNWQVLHIYGAAPAPPPPSGFLWSLHMNATTASSPALADGIIYLGIGNKIVAVDTGSHGNRWEFTASGLFSSTPVVVNGIIYAANENGHLYVLEAGSGEQVRDIAVGGKITSSPAVSGDTIYVSSEDGRLYAIK